MRQSSTGNSPEEDALAAFYARVTQRVCASFRELDAHSNTDVAALIEMNWKQRLSCYTGIQWPERADAAAAAVVSGLGGIGADASATSDAGIRGTVAINISALRTPVSTESPAPVAVAESARGPIVSRSGASQSIFAKMLGAKRKISQMDGANDDEEDGDHNNDTIATTEDSELPGSPSTDSASQVLTTSSSEVSAVLNPVWGLPVSGFPTQLSARSTRFRFRSSHRDFYGKLSAIILTLVRPLRARDIIHPGHLLWLHDECASTDASGSKGGVVEVVSLSSERLDDILVKLSDGRAVTVNKASTQRFYEFIIAKGLVQLEALH